MESTGILERFARRRSAVPVCDLCGNEIGERHRHLLEVENNGVACACLACSILFSNTGSGRYRLIPDGTVKLRDVVIDDNAWLALNLPIDLAFITLGDDGPSAFYPGPAGVIRAAISPDVWSDVVATSPDLDGIKSGVEALLIDRTRGHRAHYLAPIDECYRLAGIVRSTWRGLSGGEDAWRAIDEFFAGLDARSTPAKEVAYAGA